MPGFPKHFALQTTRTENNHLCNLRYMHEDGAFNGLLQFSPTETIISPYCKYELEPAKNRLGNTELFHLRCCYNNKYWVWSEVFQKIPSSYQIAAESNVPEEDQTKLSCTLFELLLDDDHATPKTISLRHVHLNRYISACGLTLSADVVPESVSSDSFTVFNILDWDSFVILPKKVMFKGDNNQYLSFSWIEGYPYLTFNSNDVGLPTLPNEVFYNLDGSIRIKSDSNSKFWRRSPNWIWADSSDTTTNDPDTLFWVVKGQGDNEVALRDLGNKNYCNRLTTEGKTNCLNAGVSTMTKEAILKVEEPVISRSIYNVNFHLKDSRIYDQNLVFILNKQFTNSQDIPQQTNITKTITTETTALWKNSISVKSGFKNTFETGIPKIVEGKVEILAEVASEFEYGKQVKNSETTTISDNITVPPNSTINVQVTATEGKYDVPYSYMQRDTLTNGEIVIHEMHDGFYTGSNTYNFKITVEVLLGGEP